MGSIHDSIKDDDVSGVIVGGEYVCGVLTYEGRQQGKQLYAPSESALMEAAIESKRRILEDCGAVARDIFPHADGWRLRIL